MVFVNETVRVLCEELVRSKRVTLNVISEHVRYLAACEVSIIVDCKYITTVQRGRNTVSVAYIVDRHLHNSRIAYTFLGSCHKLKIYGK